MGHGSSSKGDVCRDCNSHKCFFLFSDLKFEDLAVKFQLQACEEYYFLWPSFEVLTAFLKVSFLNAFLCILFSEYLLEMLHTTY